MATIDAHRVRRLRWQARAGTAAAALQLRGTLAAQREIVAQVLEAALDEASSIVARDGGRDRVVHLSRLELQLRISDPTALAPTLHRALVERACDGIRAQGRDPGDRHDLAGAGVPVEIHVRDALVAYLIDGRLPWTLAHLPHADCLAILREAAIALARASTLPATMAGLPAEQRVTAFGRWLALLPERERDAWIARHRPVAGDPATRGLLARLREAMRTQRDHGLSATWLAWPPVADAAFEAHCAALLDTRTGAGAPESARPAGVEPDDEGGLAGVQVPHAGLVLLHPFLPRLFDACGIPMTGSGGCDETGLSRALSLLHWLATGTDEMHEFEWPLPMLLLGRHPDVRPTGAPVPPSAEDRAEAEALLDAVRDHWPALRGTGTGALRTQFLQRRGVLSSQGGHWCLRPDGQSFDLLLATLPWSLQWVRLPWMPAPLEVLWPTS